jgi:Domain of unknown function (DUF4864)
VRTLVLWVALLVSTTFAGAAEDIAAGQAVIRSQERAFGRDDGATAYTFASPSIKSQYWNSEAFMHMVRNGYAPVHRHRSFKFGGARISEGKILQEVHIVDTNGVSWQALYTLERQPEGSLKISGAVLSKSGVALARTAHHDQLAASASSPRLAKLAPASVEAHKAPAEPAPHRLGRVMHRAKLEPASVDANKAPVELAPVEGVQNDCPRLRICAPGGNEPCEISACIRDANKAPVEPAPVEGVQNDCPRLRICAPGGNEPCEISACIRDANKAPVEPAPVEGVQNDCPRLRICAPGGNAPCEISACIR